MSYIELQLSVAAVRRVLQVATGLNVSVPSQVGKSFNVGSTQYVVQGVQAGSPTLLPPAPETYTIYFDDGAGGTLSDSIPATAVMFNQVVTYQLTAVTRSGTSNAGLFNLDLNLVVSMSAIPGTPATPQAPATPPTYLLNISPNGAAGEGQDPAIVSALQNLLNAAVKQISIPAPLVGYTVSNYGVAVDASQSVIAVRLQAGFATEPYTKGLWTLFYRGTNIDNHLQVAGKSGNVSLLLPNDLVVGMVQQAIYAGLAKHTDTLTLNRGPSSTWAPTAAGGAHVDSQFNVTVSNFGVDITVGSDFSVASSPSDTLQTNVHVGWDPNVAQEIAAVFAAGVTGGLFGAELTGGLGFIPGFIVSIVAAIVGIATFSPNLSSPACTQTDKNDMVCTTTINIPASPTGGAVPVLQFTSIAGIPDGMVVFCQINAFSVVILLSVRQYLRSINFNFANGLLSLRTPVINAKYISAP